MKYRSYEDMRTDVNIWIAALDRHPGMPQEPKAVSMIVKAMLEVFDRELNEARDSYGDGYKSGYGDCYDIYARQRKETGQALKGRGNQKGA